VKTIPPQFISVEIKVEEPGKSYVVEVRQTRQEPGKYQSRIDLRTTVPKRPQIVLRVFGEVLPPEGAPSNQPAPWAARRMPEGRYPKNPLQSLFHKLGIIYNWATSWDHLLNSSSSFAQRIESQAIKGQILISVRTIARVSNYFNVNKIETVTDVQNIQGSFKIIEVNNDKEKIFIFLNN
jgi:hypothetical protein